MIGEKPKIFFHFLCYERWLSNRVKCVPEEWFLVDPWHPVSPSWCRTCQRLSGHKQRCRHCIPRKRAATFPRRCLCTLASERHNWRPRAVDRDQFISHFLNFLINLSKAAWCDPQIMQIMCVSVGTSAQHLRCGSAERLTEVWDQ